MREDSLQEVVGLLGGFFNRVQLRSILIRFLRGLVDAKKKLCVLYTRMANETRLE